MSNFWEPGCVCVCVSQLQSLLIPSPSICRVPDLGKQGLCAWQTWLCYRVSSSPRQNQLCNKIIPCSSTSTTHTHTHRPRWFDYCAGIVYTINIKYVSVSVCFLWATYTHSVPSVPPPPHCLGTCLHLAVGIDLFGCIASSRCDSICVFLVIIFFLSILNLNLNTYAVLKPTQLIKLSPGDFI